jgi:hypothetical protein
VGGTIGRAGEGREQLAAIQGASATICNSFFMEIIRKDESAREEHRGKESKQSKVAGSEVSTLLLVSVTFYSLPVLVENDKIQLRSDMYVT